MSGWMMDRFDAASGLDAVWVDADEGAILAGTFILIRRVEGGRWQHVPLRGRPQFSTLAGAGALRVAAGYPHVVMVSNDGGARWTNRDIGAKSKLRRALCPDDRRILLAGDDGAFLSEDAGKSFRKVGRVREIAVSGRRLLGIDDLTLDRGGALWEWEDATARWVRAGSVPPWPRAFAVAGEALIVAARGGIHRSVDGSTWELVHATNALVTAAYGTPAGLAAMCGCDGYLTRSFDGGLTWTEEEPHTDRKLDGVHITKAGELWAAGADGVVVRSGAAGPLQTVVAPAPGPAGRSRSRRGAPAPAPAPVGEILRVASTPPVWTPPELALPGLTRAVVTAATFLREDRAVAGDAAGRVFVLARNGEGRWSPVDELRLPVPADARIDALATHGSILFICAAGRLLSVDLDDGGVAGPLPSSPPKGVTHLVARAGRLAAAGPGAAHVWTISGESLEALCAAALPAGELTDLDLSVDGRWLAAVIDAGTVVVIDAGTGAPAGRWKRRRARVRFAPDASRIYLASDRFHVHLVSAQKGSGTHQASTASSPHRRIVASPSASLLALLSDQDELDVIETAGETVLLHWEATSTSTLTGAPRPLGEDEVRQRTFSRHRLVIAEHAAITAVALSDGGQVLCGDRSGEIAVFDASTLEAQRIARPAATRVQPGFGAPLLDVPAIAAGELVGEGRAVFLGADGGLREVDPTTGEVRRGPFLDVSASQLEPVSVVPRPLLAVGATLLVATENGWLGFDRESGERRFSASFPVRQAVFHRGALYGFERRHTYTHGERVGHRLYRLDPRTFAVSEVTLSPPPGAADADGFLTWLTSTPAGLLSGFADKDHGVRGVLVDPETGTVVGGPLQWQGDAPVLQLLKGSATVGPSGRYLLWGSREACVIRDGHDPALRVITTLRMDFAEYSTPFVEAGRVVNLARGSEIRVYDLDGALVARFHGGAPRRTTQVFGGPAGGAFLTWNPGEPVRRWPLP